MTNARYVCNYAILQFLPSPSRGEFVNVGVLVACANPCLLHFVSEAVMSERTKALFPQMTDHDFEAAFQAFKLELDRVRATTHDPKSVQRAFNEIVRARESAFRFGEVRSIVTPSPENLAEELLTRYVRVETSPTAGLQSAAR